VRNLVQTVDIREEGNALGQCRCQQLDVTKMGEVVDGIGLGHDASALATVGGPVVGRSGRHVRNQLVLWLNCAPCDAHTQDVSPTERNTSSPYGDTSTSVVRRLAAVLDAFRAGDVYLGVNEIARRTQLPKSTVSRLVKEMDEAGFLERKAEKVGLGLKMFEWGERASRRFSVREVALPFMADLREATRQTIHLAVLDGTEVVYVEILQREGAPRLPSKVGGRLPAHATGVGKALLSASEPAVIERAIAAGLVTVGPRTIRNPDVLRQQIRRAAVNGIAYEQEESGPGIVCVASAVLDSESVPVAAISASGWAGKVDLRRVGPAVHTAALSVSRVLASRDT
jgi:IclR family transcriptional regulator, acetate operon repressor